MLIDATHAEETRVVVVDGNKVEEFDFEAESKRQLAGNIYLAKVTRVEPSLQAAFVDYGGNRHGFLAFSEIHPDYYQIPVADREALMEEDRAYAEAQNARDDDEEKSAKRSSSSRSRSKSSSSKSSASKTQAETVKSDDAVETQDVEKKADESPREISGMETIDLDAENTGAEVVTEAPAEIAAEETVAPAEVTESVAAEAEAPAAESPAEAEEAAEAVEAAADAPAEAADEAEGEASDDAAEDDSAEDDADEETNASGEDSDEEDNNKSRRTVSRSRSRSDAASKDDTIESVSDDDDQEDIRPIRKPRPRRYKIQEVIKVRQILLVQVVKEERGNKGAALTTYLSLAGRYCVLMPNTARGGGISRKITNATDRKKLKEIATEIDVPKGAGLIVRTAGAKRTKAEIKRDYEYLQRLWEQIRELTLKSIAPAKIYEEGDLIKRSIRDLYNREIDEVFVEGERGYRNAKDFMKMIMPSHAKNVKQYSDALPLFARYQVESYLAAMFNPTVQLKSGGYIVIGVTEALVAIDVNSGKATKEGSIEETALKTNLEAADEVARQLRLRDLAGLIVIDFIDMDERKNNAAVEKRMKDRLKSDRARIQVGRISGFGLMEMSRQRLRPGMLEATTQPCPSCHGTGLIRSDDNMALSILRQIEEEGVRGRSREVLVKCPVGIANFLMNSKREHIEQIEQRYGMAVRVEGHPHLISPDFEMEKFKQATRAVPVAQSPVVSVDTTQFDMDDIDISDEDATDEDNGDNGENGDSDDQPKKKRRRSRSRSRRRSSSSKSSDRRDDGNSDDDGDESNGESSEAETSGNSKSGSSKSGSSKSGSSRSGSSKSGSSKSGKSREDDKEPVTAEASETSADDAAPAVEEAAAEPVEAVTETADAPAEPGDAPTETAEAAPEAVEEVAEAAPAETVEAAAEPVAEEPAVEEPVAEETAPEPETVAETVAEEPVTNGAALQETAAEETETEAPAPEPADVAVAEAEPEPDKPKRRGWWSLGS